MKYCGSHWSLLWLLLCRRALITFLLLVSSSLVLGEDNRDADKSTDEGGVIAVEFAVERAAGKRGWETRHKEPARYLVLIKDYRREVTTIRVNYGTSDYDILRISTRLEDKHYDKLVRDLEEAINNELGVKDASSVSSRPKSSPRGFRGLIGEAVRVVDNVVDDISGQLSPQGDKPQGNAESRADSSGRSNVRDQEASIELPEPTWSKGDVRIAVLPLSSATDDRSASDAIGRRIESALSDTGYFTLQDQERLKEIIDTQTLQNSDLFAESGKASEVGGLLGVHALVYGGWSRIGSTYTLSMKLVDVERGVVLWAADDEHQGVIDGLLDVATRLARKLALDYYEKKKPSDEG